MFTNLHRSITILFLIIALHSPVFAAGESAVITLVFPHSSRSYGMGETGTALCDDETVVFWNPAGLALNDNTNWQGGTAHVFFEPLLPIFGIHELWHTAVSTIYQPPFGNIGGFSIDYNYINMGVNEWTDDLGRFLGRAHSYEFVLTGGWGFNFKELGIDHHNFGFSAKYIHSALAPGLGSYGEGVGKDLAIDAGYLWEFQPGAHFGLCMANMGPNIFYISQDQSDPLPFTINIALSYEHLFKAEGLKILNIATEYRLSREIVKTYIDKRPDPFWRALYTDWDNHPMREVQTNVGFEATVMNTGVFRQGYLFDFLGQRFESHYGLGIRILNHYIFDMSFIYAPEGYMKKRTPFHSGANGARHGQWQLSFIVEGFASGSEKDLTWWRE